MDPRRTPANDRVAATHLRGTVDATNFAEGTVQRITVPLANLLRAPAGPRDRQLLMGDEVTVYDISDGMAFVQAGRDGYVGYVDATCLGDGSAPTHWVAVPATHAYSAEDIKSPEVHSLSFGSQISVTAERKAFMETAQGWFIPKKHLWPEGKRFADPVIAAQLHFGVPYLWGGNSIWGIDCSGLVQAACLAAGLPCPGDSDMQEASLGTASDDRADLQRGDLLFWPGHVGMMVDVDTLLHANAHHMSVAYEPIAAAILRIRAQGGGEVTSRRRL